MVVLVVRALMIIAIVVPVAIARILIVITVTVTIIIIRSLLYCELLFGILLQLGKSSILIALVLTTLLHCL